MREITLYVSDKWFFILGLAGAILGLLYVKFSNKDKKLKTKFDERQKIVNYKARAYAFIFMCIYYAACIIIIGLGFNIPATLDVIVFMGIVVGVGIVALYTAYYNADIGLNNSETAIIILFKICALVTSLCLLIIAIFGGFLENGILQLPSLCIIVCIWEWVYLWIIKKHKKMAKED